VAIRSGLARLEGVESVSPRADFKTATFEVRWKNSQFIDPHTFSNHIYGLSLGARLRGLEATVDGTLKKEGGQLFLHVRGTNTTLRLTPLRLKVQQDVKKKKPVPPTPVESKAYKNLVAQWKGEAKPVRITGPLVMKKGATTIDLEVRQFELAP
jgi:hypothetical protein